jgi:two-component system cell cycle sensor histidine kinase/response regulator CckA
MNRTSILIVEDEFIVANDIEARLIDLGYAVAGKADSGAAAIELAGSISPDLVLMDIRIHGPMDGITAATEIRCRFKLPVVFLTAYTDDSTLERAKKAEPFGYILKPFEDRELRTNIEIAVYKHKAETEIQRLTRLYATLSQVNQAIVRARSPEELFPKICEIALEFGKFKAARIARLNNVTGALIAVAKAGADAGITLGETISHCGCASAAVQQGRPCLINELCADARTVPCRERAGNAGLRACGAYPIRLRGQVCGVFVVATPEADFFNEAEMHLLDEVALDISFALDSLETEQQRSEAESALKEREQHLQAILQTALDGFWLLDKRGRFIDVNDAYCAMSGYSREQLLQMRVKDLESEETEQETAAHIQRIIRHGGDRFETCHRRRDGKLIDVEVHVTFQSFDGGRLVCFLHDITDRKRAERELRESQHRLQIAMAAASLGVWSRDLITGEIFWDEQTRAIYGVAADAVITYEGLFDLIVPEDRDLVPQQLQKDESNLTLEFRILWPDGTIRWIHLRGSTMTDTSGKPIRRTGVVMDITDKKLAEQGMRALEEQFRHAQKMEAVGRLAGGVAHDFNNLLMVIRTYAELLQEGLPAYDGARQKTQEIVHAADRAASLTAQLLAFSRKQIASCKIIDLNIAIHETTNMLKRLVGEDIELHFNATDSSWAVKADPDQIVQVLMNLCVNARDAMPQGGTITIATGNVTLGRDSQANQRAQHLPPGEYVELSVTDTGTGISKEIQERMFEPFFTTKEVGKGTGLGLSTVYGIVEQSGGHICIDSEIGKGSCFTIYLPKAADKAAPAMAEGRDGYELGTETLLVVEDEDALRGSISYFLRSLGYTVLEAESGHRALSLVADFDGAIHLLLTDLVMPRMGGRELSEMLHTLRPDLKTIFMSGYTDDAVVRYGVRDAGLMFLQKPFSMATLARQVRAALPAADKVQ